MAELTIVASQGAGTSADSQSGTAWQPGLASSIPSELAPLVTLYRPEHAYRSYAECRGLAEFTGLKALDLIALRPERLVLHELLVRVTADLSVPDGPDYEVLGLNLRGMVRTLHDQHVKQQLPAIEKAFEDERQRASDFIDRQLREWIYPDSTAADHLPDSSASTTSNSTNPDLTASGSTDTPASRTGQARAGRTDAGRTGTSWMSAIWLRLSGGAAKTAAGPSRHGTHSGSASGSSERADDRPNEIRAVAHWKRCLSRLDEPFERHCIEALVRVVGTITGHRGRLIVDRSVLARIATDQACKRLGSELISRLVDPLFAAGVAAEGYCFLPPQAKPVIMNVKGASASGKSTIRPQQRQLAEKLGIPWSDFALISPDYWRKSLLDYQSLGKDFKYGAMLTGQELAIIDKQLDRYMACKASRSEMSHLLIDRFRFDSFTLEKGRSADSRLLTRFGDRVYLFFMITPPAETVERAWKRGLTTGRYKAVDDLLHHNIEAYDGIPSLFLSWITADDKQIHVEFLDNDVPQGQLPRTAAFGWNDSLTILDVTLFIDIDRFRKVNVGARQAQDVLDPAEQSAEDNLAFWNRCVGTISDIRLADRDTGELYARVRDGNLVWWDHSYIELQPEHGGVKTVLRASGYARQPLAEPAADVPEIDLAAEQQVTVGAWGDAGKPKR